MSDDLGDVVAPPTLRELAAVWWQIGLWSFGGPAAHVALMHREIVERRRWIDEERYLHALQFCMLLPGPEAQQLAAWMGWVLRGVPGALVSGGLFVVPGAVLMFALSSMYVTFHEIPVVAAALVGLKAAVVAVVAEAVQRLARRGATQGWQRAFAVASFAAMSVGAPFPAIVGASALAGAGYAAWRPSAFEARSEGEQDRRLTLVDRLAEAGLLAHTAPSVSGSLRAVGIGLAVWWGPLVAVAAATGADGVLATCGRLFSTAAMVTFGGAYAVLAWIGERGVALGWLTPTEMTDALGLAETTPGPLILVVQHVGFLAGFRNPEALGPWGTATAAVLVTLWATFAPCFVWILAGGPWIEAARRVTSLRAALGGISASVVGVVAHLGVWFAVHAWFGEVGAGPWGVLVPVWRSLQVAPVALSAFAAWALLVRHASLPRVIGACVLLGVAWEACVGALGGPG
jgi:chromate transporter